MNRKEKIRFGTVVLAVLIMAVGMIVVHEPKTMTIMVPAYTYTTK